MGFDLLLLGIFLIIAEKAILKDKYLLFSPYLILNISVLYIYVLPLIMARLPDSVNYLSRLSDELVQQLLVEVRIFYYLFACFCLYSMFRISRTKIEEKSLEEDPPILTSKFMLLSWVCLITIASIVDFAKVEFDPSLFISMQLDPRSFTYLRSGLGPLNYAVNVAKMLLFYISAMYFFQKKTLSATILLGLACIVNLAGGSKSSLLVALVFLIVIRQKKINPKRRMNTLEIVSVFAIFAVAILISFYVMRGSMEINSFSELIDFITSYAQEAYYSARVINDFDWDIYNVWIAIRSFILTPIPRQIFAGKEYYGFYQECWRHLYQEGSVLYQSSAYGFLAEGHMLFGVLSPVFSAFIINAISNKLYRNYYTTSSLSGVFILAYLYTRMYFYTRTGYLDATNIWALIIFYLGSKLFFSIMNGYTRKQKQRYS